MTKYTLTKTRIENGIWHGVLTGGGNTQPQLTATHQGVKLSEVALEHDTTQNYWMVAVTVPAAAITEGIQTVLISDENGTKLASFSLVAGGPLEDDIRAEVDLLRAELDLLKSAFRAHCNNS
ncbi:hypothetical protein DS901_10910 [Loktanella sp. D2R18]|uniref:hypothetical protein n=1 Tax=Rhodobacterales TaxID=204455 RepID=UPI000DE9B055|nr:MULTISPECIES: hypothetical protein [Rhodobacterales]MDO6590903.1 hypothetical protein [Yoonia sp. 1_MG-2023]RBW43320.1 hypothetical protein DS901_10910 [Loktanella sp. D2R18]